MLRSFSAIVCVMAILRGAAALAADSWAEPDIQAARTFHLLVTYQPAGRFWPFQFIEAGIFVALTAAALGATIWLLHRRATWTA